MANAIEMKDITQVFSLKSVLNGVTLSVPCGQILGLLGPSGAGKTTLVKILTGQLMPTNGSAKLLWTDTRMMDDKIRNKIGIMMDQFGLYDRLTVYENLRFFANILGVSAKKIDEVLNNVGLLDAKKIRVSKLSKGMRSRLSLARAVINDAEVLFLDEPTAGLDPATTSKIHKLMLAQKEKGTTIFLTTHNMVEAESICDKVALLYQGEIVEYGSPKQLMRKYNHKNQLMVELRDGNLLEVDNDQSSANLIKNLMEQDSILTIHSTEPNLETIFMELTGRGLE